MSRDIVILHGKVFERQCAETGCEGDIYRLRILQLEKALKIAEMALRSFGFSKTEQGAWTPPDTLDLGISEIAAERQRQVTQEGYTAEHDDQHIHSELAAAGACYALTGWSITDAMRLWPFDREGFKQAERLKDLRRAGDLIAAEISRFKRAETK